MLKMILTDNGCKVEGEVDIATASQFNDAIREQIKKGLPELVLDLTDMEYIDSTGIGILMDIKKNVLPKAHSLVLLNPKRSILKLMQLTGADQIFEIRNEQVSK